MRKWFRQEGHNEGSVFRKVTLDAVWRMVRAEEVSAERRVIAAQGNALAWIRRGPARREKKWK